MHHNRSRRRVFHSLFDGVRGHGDADGLCGLDLVSVGIAEGDVDSLEAVAGAFHGVADGFRYFVEGLFLHSGQNHGCSGGEGAFLGFHMDGDVCLCGQEVLGGADSGVRLALCPCLTLRVRLVLRTRLSVCRGLCIRLLCCRGRSLDQDRVLEDQVRHVLGHGSGFLTFCHIAIFGSCICSGPGILLGRGLDIDQAQEELKGVTLESLVVAVRVARAVKKHIAAGKLSAADFPLLLHTDEILTEKKPVNIPWESFTFER